MPPLSRQRRLSGIARLYGDAALPELAAARVLIAGIGGVGSWAAEALVRSGIGTLTLVDLDHIAESNLNRQVHALSTNLGQAKVTAMAERIAAIDPDCRVDVIDAFVSPENAQELAGGGHDLIIDAIDQGAAKAALIAAAVAANVPVLCCGAAGGRRDATQLRIADLSRCHGDSLLARLRNRLRREHGFPASDRGAPIDFGVETIYSLECAERPTAACRTPAGPLSCAGYGSLISVTACMGLIAAGRAIERLVIDQSS